jgi:mono/diheme cytochrome c family protein
MVNNQVLNSNPRRSHYFTVALGILAFCVFLAFFLGFLTKTDAYTQSVLNLEGNPTKGRSIFVMNCVDCHGQWADGKVGPSLKNVSERFSKVRLIHQVVSGETPPMPQFQPATQEMADLLSYLNQL